MPSRPDPLDPVSTTQRIVKNSTCGRILIVDDEMLIRWSLCEALREQGYDVFEASDGRSALRALRAGAFDPDVVLLDYRLPDSDDLRLLSTIKQLLPHGRVILMTAYGSPEVAQGALELGAYRVVNKPFEMHDLAALVAEAAARSS